MKIVFSICMFLSLNGTLVSMDKHQKILSLVTKNERCLIVNYLREKAKISELSEEENNDFLEKAEQVQRSITFDMHKKDYRYVMNDIVLEEAERAQRTIAFGIHKKKYCNVMDGLLMRAFLADWHRDFKRAESTDQNQKAGRGVLSSPLLHIHN